MASILFHADTQDFQLILEWLNNADELAFIISDGHERWKAVSSVPTLNKGKLALWHVPSGPLPLLHPRPSREISQVTDPWVGWKELRPGADPSRPFFGAGHPGIIWLNVHSEARLAQGVVGLSYFEWIGNHYRIIGHGADPSTESFWRALRQWVQKSTKKPPPEYPKPGFRGTVYIFPSALAVFKAKDKNL